MKMKGNLWSNKRNTFLMLIGAVMVLVLAVSFISLFRAEIINEEEEGKPYDSMYNASRYFFRIFYPNDWDINSDPYGFLLNEKEGLVLEAFPLKKIAVTPSPAPSGGVTPSPTAQSSPTASATVDPRAGMERNTELTISFYYKEYDALNEYLKNLLPTASASPAETPFPTASPTVGSTSSNGGASASPALKTPPVQTDVIADYVFDQFKKEHETAGYGYSGKKIFETENTTFIVLPYHYIQNDIKMAGELYVAARAMCYYVVRVEGTETAFNKHNSVIQNILYHMTFSVFKY